MWISVIDFFKVESSCTTRDQVKLSEPIEHPAVRAQGWRSWDVNMTPFGRFLLLWEWVGFFKFHFLNICLSL